MLQNFLLNILLTFVWVALTGHMDYANFAFGYTLGFFILWMVNRSIRANTEYFYRVPKIFAFIFLFFYDLLKANFEVMKDVVTPNYNMKPGIVKYELEAKTDFEITMLANMIALTPGTVVVDLSKDKKFMYIHVMYLTDKEAFKSNLNNRIERKLLDIIR